MKKTTLLGAVTAAVASFAVATPLAAQDRPSYELPAIEVAVLQNESHQQAIALYEFPDRWEEAARLHKQAADELPKNDAGQYYGYSRAGLLFFYAGEFDDARRMMEEAAEVAEATGDIFTAANAFVDAAFVAIAEGFAGKKREMVREARKLLESEWLTPEEKASVLQRIDGAPAGPESARVALAVRLGSPMTLAAD